MTVSQNSCFYPTRHSLHGFGVVLSAARTYNTPPHWVLVVIPEEERIAKNDPHLQPLVVLLVSGYGQG